MAYALPPLQWLRAFEAAARLSSFSAAAEELNLTPAAVSIRSARWSDICAGNCSSGCRAACN